MKKLLVVVVAIALVVWVISWFRSPDAVATSAAKPWPGGMGPLASADARAKTHQANAASVKLTALATALGANEAVDEFVAREIARGDVAIGQPPALPDVTAIRELLLREPVVWQRHGEFDHPDVQARRPLQLAVARALVANALAKARANDASAWDDLHATWKLAGTLDGHPQMLAQTASLTITRTINGVAWKLPLPAPAWFAELQARDPVRPLLEAFQYMAASYAGSGAQLFPTKFLANDVEHDRAIAQELFATTQCDVTTRMNKLGTDLTSVWRRAFRYRAEREATANALRAREGKPIEPKSVCSDGSWTSDGTTLRFARTIPTAAPDRPMPLVLRVRPER